MEFITEGVKLDSKLFVTCLRSVLSGWSPFPGGCTNEMLRVCSDDPEALLLLTSAVEGFARASVPEGIFNCFTMATMTALQKREGGIRAVATSTSFRRFVAKTMAKQFMTGMEQACAPFQFALSACAVTECVGHAAQCCPLTESERAITCIEVRFFRNCTKSPFSDPCRRSSARHTHGLPRIGGQRTVPSLALKFLFAFLDDV